MLILILGREPEVVANLVCNIVTSVSVKLLSDIGRHLYCVNAVSQNDRALTRGVRIR
jgi:hypothetical protein